MENRKATFKPGTIHKLLQQSFKDQQKTKVNNDGITVMVEMLRTFVAEAAARAGQQAKSEEAATVQTEHLEKILPQLLLDF
ncbi:centromere protein X [Exaiptasia diaphana]|uniref:Centromere protein X n=1 Tax=Exaiptasia diaphana TaxID=2652724 RepID=A0A913X6X9_EXADI|nr:centromere protein X [Exaiptasia diaphana]